MTERMGKVMAAYAELPVRLLSARSPVDFRTEYFRIRDALVECSTAQRRRCPRAKVLARYKTIAVRPEREAP